MPDNDKMKISALPSALVMDNTDELPVNQGGAGAKTTKKATVAVLGSHIAETMQFSSELQTQDKTLVGAINEIAQGGGGGGSWTDLTATLIAGNTSVTIQNAAITANSTIQVFENVGAYSDLIEPTDIVVSVGEVVITFPAQSSDLSVKVRVS